MILPVELIVKIFSSTPQRLIGLNKLLTDTFLHIYYKLYFEKWCKIYGICNNLSISNPWRIKIIYLPQNLESLINLEELNLLYAGIISIKNIRLPLNLINLDLSHNKIKEITNVGWPLNLEYLNLSNNKISEIEDLCFNKLKYINLSNNQIKNINNKKISATIERIDLSNNPLKNKTIEKLKLNNLTCNIIFKKIKTSKNCKK